MKRSSNSNQEDEQAKKLKISNNSGASPVPHNPLGRPMRPIMNNNNTNSTNPHAQMPVSGPVGIRPMRPRIESSSMADVQHRIAMAKAERQRQIELETANQQKELESSIFKADKKKSQGGLNVAFHPALMMNIDQELKDIKNKRYNMKDKVLPVKEIIEKQQEEEKLKVNPYLDPLDRIRTSETPKPRTSRNLKFAEPGKFIELANNQRAQESLENLKKEIAKSVKAAGIEKEMELVADSGLRTKPPPKVEWWDAKLVNGSYETFNIKAHNPIVEELVTRLVQRKYYLIKNRSCSYPAPSV